MGGAIRGQSELFLRAGVSLVCAAVVNYSIGTIGVLSAGRWDWVMLLVLSAALMAAVWWLTGAIRDDMTVMLLIAVLLGAGMFIRLLCMNHITADYNDFLQHWVARFRLLGAAAFRDNFSDYNMPYLYFLYLISKIRISDLYLIKALSVLFDLLNVVVCVKLAAHFKLDVNRKLIVAGAVWLAPTMWLNSGYWGQCDSIYAFFALSAVYLALKKRPVLSVAAAALAFSFKLQTIFLLPIYLVFLIAKKVKLRHAAVFPAVYVASVLPAMLAGKPLGEILGVYTNQVGLYDDRLNLNSPSAYALLPGSELASHDVFFPLGIALAAVFVCAVLFFAWRGRDRLDDAALLLCAFVLCAGVPWLLPSMHERYFYLSDLFSILAVALIPRRWYVAPMVVYASYGGYHAYLFGQYLAFGQLGLPAVLMGAAAASMAAVLYARLFPISDADPDVVSGSGPESLAAAAAQEIEPGPEGETECRNG